MPRRRRLSAEELVARHRRRPRVAGEALRRDADEHVGEDRPDADDLPDHRG